MAGPIFSNNAVATLAAGYSAAATALTLTAGTGARFPSPAAGEWFPVTIVDPSNQIEIVYCTGRTADTLTVTRGQEGTPARALGAGEKVEHRLTAGALAAIRDRPLDASQIPDGSITGAKIAHATITNGNLDNQTIQGGKIALNTIASYHLHPTAVVDSLGYTPVQQGGGVGMTANKIRIGWSEPKIRAQVDATDYGFLLGDKDNGDPSAAGYRGTPQIVRDTNYVPGYIDSGKALLHTSGAHTWTIPPNTTAAFVGGSLIKANNLGGSLTIAPGPGVVLVWLPSGATGARTLAAPGSAIIEKLFGDTWWIYGAGLS